MQNLGQITGERVGGVLGYLDYSSCFIKGNPSTDIGVYSWESITPLLNSTTWGSLAVQHISE
jgi:hypothetical protein